MEVIEAGQAVRTGQLQTLKVGVVAAVCCCRSGRACPVSTNFPFCHPIVLIGHHLPLNFPRLAVSPTGLRAAMQRASRTVMPAGASA